VVHYLPHLAIALIVLAAFVMVWRTEGDDPGWRARWASLTPKERVRIGAAARSGALLASQEEIELAAGYARRERRRRRPSRLISAVDVPAGLALILGGIVAHAAIFIAFGAAFFLLGLVRLRRAHRIGRGLRETIARDLPRPPA
jgi:hypothetical protein